MSNAHTPGPWTVSRGGWDDNAHACYSLEGVKDVRVADARLIAAAPDLLALLNEAVELQRNHYGYGISLHVEMASWADKASAAIAKATGASDE